MALKIIGVMGSGTKPFRTLAASVGQAIATRGFHLLTGAGGGVMTEVARAFVAVQKRDGLSIGVVRAKATPKLNTSGKREWEARVSPPEVVEIPIFTHLPLSGRDGKDTLSRNHINVLTSAGVIVLPGSEGTRSELELALEYGKHALLYIGTEKIDGFSVDELLAKYNAYAGQITMATEPVGLSSWLEQFV